MLRIIFKLQEFTFREELSCRRFSQSLRRLKYKCKHTLATIRHSRLVSVSFLEQRKPRTAGMTQMFVIEQSNEDHIPLNENGMERNILHTLSTCAQVM